MNFPIYFLLINCLSIIIGETSPFPDVDELEKIASGKQLNITGSNIKLKLSKGGEIFRNQCVLVWKGTFNRTIDVAIKIVEIEKAMYEEMNIYNALGATDNFDIEKHRIPRVYYHGPILEKYFAIAMTLFEETLGNRLEHVESENKKFSEPTILLIFKQAVESLNYIHSKNVAHNDIKLRNIFIRGEDIFIGDFDSSELFGDFMEDYTTLLSWIWDMQGVSYRDSNGPDDGILKYFKNKIVKEAFTSILNTENKKGEHGILPDYEKIIKISKDAIAKISKKSKPLQFDWLNDGMKASSSGTSSKHSN